MIFKEDSFQNGMEEGLTKGEDEETDQLEGCVKGSAGMREGPAMHMEAARYKEGMYVRDLVESTELDD